ncbi:hypothetical protein GGR35_003150 [Mucilaginibacter phyllosphaerae]|uniref:Uncharacterized protein n=1 Tax=Mucilaginibacter phyllosphaerae TaxID=1812349 RepID=A0ABR6IC32_9SPHI|nr:hypothetical protein [Mucilaginibacter phyllosphaerae]
MSVAIPDRTAGDKHAGDCHVAMAYSNADSKLFFL